MKNLNNKGGLTIFENKAFVGVLSSVVYEYITLTTSKIVQHVCGWSGSDSFVFIFIWSSILDNQVSVVCVLLNFVYTYIMFATVFEFVFEILKILTLLYSLLYSSF